jgi:hypothetical protein
MLARSSEDDHFRSRVIVCRSLLGATTCVPRDLIDPQFDLSSTDAWPNRASKPNPGGYTTSLCNGISKELG